MRRLDELFAAAPPQPPPEPCPDGDVSEAIDPLPAVPPFSFSVISQPQMKAEVDKLHQERVPTTPLGLSQPSFERVPFKDLPNQSLPVTVSAVPDENGGCFKCVADWELPVAWRSLIASGPFVLDEPERFFVSRAGDVSGCPPHALPPLLEVRELLTPAAVAKITAGELEHYLDFVRAFRIVGGRYLANVRRLTAERTHLRARDPGDCEAKVQTFLVRARGFVPADGAAADGASGSPASVPGAAPGPPAALARDAGSGVVDLNFLTLYGEFFRDDFLALYLAPDRDREPDGPHHARVHPPTDRPPTTPNIDIDVNPFGCDAYCRKVTFPQIPGRSSEDLVKDRGVPARRPWHVM